MAIVKMYYYIIPPEIVDIFSCIVNILQKLDGKLKHHSQKGVSYTIEYKIGSDKFVFLVSYGKPKPNRCYITNENLYDDSVLSDNVIHLTNQFIFIVYNDRVLCSDHYKKNIIFNYLNTLNTEFDCELLSVSTSIEEFVQQVRSIDSISITATNNIFIDQFLNPSWGDDLEEKEKPETTTVKMNFKRALKEKFLIKIYKKLVTQIKQSYISKFNINGENETGFISINEESIVAKDSYEFEKEEGYYDINEIFDKV